jgi:hypothetical protein
VKEVRKPCKHIKETVKQIKEILTKNGSKIFFGCGCCGNYIECFECKIKCDVSEGVYNGYGLLPNQQ